MKPYLFVALVAFLGINAWYGTGVVHDPFRDGKILYLVLACSLATATWIGRRFNFFLGSTYALVSIDWLFFHQFSVSSTMPLVLSAATLFLADFLAKEPGIVFPLLRMTAWIQVGLGIVQLAGAKTFYWTVAPHFGWYIPFGTTGHPVVFGAVLAMLLPLSLAKWTKIESLLIFVLILATRSTMPVLAVVAAGGWYSLNRWKWWCVPSLTLLLWILVAGAYWLPSTEFFDFNGRWVPWRRAWELIQENPFGYGIGSWVAHYVDWKVPYNVLLFDPASGQMQPVYWAPMHNDWLEFLFDAGVVPFSLLIAGAFRVLLKAELWAACSVIALFANALGSFPFHLAITSFIFSVILCLGTREKHEHVY